MRGEGKEELDQPPRTSWTEMGQLAFGGSSSSSSGLSAFPRHRPRPLPYPRRLAFVVLLLTLVLRVRASAASERNVLGDRDAGRETENIAEEVSRFSLGASASTIETPRHVNCGPCPPPKKKLNT